MWQLQNDPNDNITQFESFKYKVDITGKAPAAGNIKDVETAVSLRYLSNFWRTLELSLINCESNFILTSSEYCIIPSATGATKIKITDTKHYVPVVTLSTQDNAKLLQQLKSGFKRAINWNKYQTKKSTERQNQYLDFLIDPSFQRVNGLLVLPFENEGNRTVNTEYYLPKVETKNYNVMIVAKNLFLLGQFK